jgi:hypothetical protein
MPMQAAEEIAAARKAVEHLEATLALADETKDGIVGYLVESALDHCARTRGRGIWACRRASAPSRRQP